MLESGNVLYEGRKLADSQFQPGTRMLSVIVQNSSVMASNVTVLPKILHRSDVFERKEVSYGLPGTAIALKIPCLSHRTEKQGTNTMRG